VIAASNGSFEDALSQGRFREDLFYRLNVLRINVPPLRERGEDHVILARHFMEQISHEMGIATKPFSTEATDVLKLHDWPGNIREMKNVIQRAVVLCDGAEIDASHLSIFERHRNPDERDDDPGQTIRIPDIGLSLAEIEAEALRITLKLTGGNRSAAARILAISRPTIHRKIRDYGLEVGA
jgi:two-component system response regulator HydG